MTEDDLKNLCAAFGTTSGNGNGIRWADDHERIGAVDVSVQSIDHG